MSGEKLTEIFITIFFLLSLEIQEWGDTLLKGGQKWCCHEKFRDFVLLLIAGEMWLIFFPIKCIIVNK